MSEQKIEEGTVAAYVARELHDVVVAFGRPLTPFEDMSPAARAWFEDRAKKVMRMVAGKPPEGAAPA